MVEQHVSLSVPVAKQPPGWAENRREFARRKNHSCKSGDLGGFSGLHPREFPVSADMRPASQAGCLFLGSDNSVIGVVAERFGSATHKPAEILEISRAGIFVGFQALVCTMWLAGGRVKNGEVLGESSDGPRAAPAMVFFASLRCAQPGAAAGVAGALAAKPPRTTLGAEAESVATDTELDANGHNSLEGSS